MKTPAFISNRNCYASVKITPPYGGMPLPVLPWFLILSFRREKGENGFMNRRKEACHCKNVTYGMIEDAVRNGANTLQQVMDVTGAGKGCGKCREFLEYLIRDILDAQKNA